MESNNDILEPRLVAVDTYTPCHVDDYMQDVSNDCESLAYALNLIETSDPASKGMIVAVRSSLLAHSERASKMSADIMAKLILQDEVSNNEYQPTTWKVSVSR